MNNYKYFRDVLKNGYFTETPCQFCGSSEHCLEGSFFDRDDNLVSICLNCFDKRKVSVDICCSPRKIRKTQKCGITRN